MGHARDWLAGLERFQLTVDAGPAALPSERLQQVVVERDLNGGPPRKSADIAEASRR